MSENKEMLKKKKKRKKERKKRRGHVKRTKEPTERAPRPNLEPSGQ